MKTIILFSGGLDSTVLLGNSVRLLGKEKISTIFIDYGQTHRKQEWGSAYKIAKELYVPLERIELPFIKQHNLGSGILMGGDKIFSENLATSFLPMRNPLMLTIATMKALSFGERTEIYAGYTAEDFILFPDCRTKFLDIFTKMVELATESFLISFKAPFITFLKKDVVALGYQHNMENIMKMSWSCYKDGDEPCGECGACKVRMSGGLS